jgi:predicted nucleic acid-binding protein
MKYVIDTSVAFKWEVVEIESDKALRLRDDFRNGVHELLAPEHFPAEIANSLLATHVANCLSFLPHLHPCAPLLPRVVAITSAFQVSVYDSLYVALAERESCEFVTADDKLVRALQATFPFIVSLASMP